MADGYFKPKFNLKRIIHINNIYEWKAILKHNTSDTSAFYVETPQKKSTQTINVQKFKMKQPILDKLY